MRLPHDRSEFLVTYGDGRIRPDKGGWLADIGVSGTRHRRWFGTRAKAQAWLVQMRAERTLRTAGRLVASRPTVTYLEAAES